MLLGATVASAQTGCVEVLGPGEYGNFRYVGNVRGEAPLNVLPPISDREGNSYVLYGGLDLINDTQLFIGLNGGGWAGDGCDVTFGNDFGVHGFVGRAQNRAWYWSGEALVKASAKSGRCSRLLEFDPSSGARLAFKALVPFVHDTPSRTTAVAWIQSPTDPRPFEVVIDLNNEVYTSIQELDPSSAENVQVLGVGASPLLREGVVLARFTQGESVRVRAFFYNHLGERVDAADLSGLEMLPEYGIPGYLMGTEAGLYAAVDVEGQLILLDKSGGRRLSFNGMTALGVHRWDDVLYVVGEADGRPKIASIDDDGDVGSIKTWDTSLEALDQLGGTIDVVDDRSLPSRDLEWRNARVATGNFPFVTAHSADFYADDTTTTLVAGPSFSAGGEARTAIALAPVGIAYEE